MTALTHWRKLNNPNYLGAYSLEKGKDLTVEIEKVVKENLKDVTGVNEEATVAYLKGQKPMILNSTNCKIINRMYDTPYIEEWVGKKITVYAAKIKAFGETMEALRIREVIPLVELPELTPDSPKWEDAAAAVRLKNTTIKAIKKHYTLTKANEKLLCENSK